MKIEKLEWENFGFPDPAFISAWLPAEGLCKALAERQLPFSSGEWDLEPIAKNDQLPRLSEYQNGQSWCIKFDEELRVVAEQYFNHVKFESAPELSGQLNLNWTWDELLEAVATDDEPSVDPTRGDLSPDWNLNWLLQRKAMIDLLLFAPIPYAYDCISGSVHNGEPSSPTEAIEAALGDQTPRQTSGLPATYVHNIYGPDHGWREGSYCCNISVTTRIYADLPEDFERPDDIALVLNVTGSDGTAETFSGGKELSHGINVFKANRRGDFVKFSPRDIANLAGRPRKGRQTYGGWKSILCQAFADYTAKFQFKGKND